MKKLSLAITLLLLLVSCKRYTLLSVELIREAEVIYCVSENSVMELDMSYRYSSKIEDGILYLKIDGKNIVTLGPKEAIIKEPGRGNKIQVCCTKENYEKLKKYER